MQLKIVVAALAFGIVAALASPALAKTGHTQRSQHYAAEHGARMHRHAAHRPAQRHARMQRYAAEHRARQHRHRAHMKAHRKHH